MDILLHLGAHRCATTTFQSFLWSNRTLLAKRGLTSWTPRRTRDGLMRGLLRHPALVTLEHEKQGQRSVGRIRVEVERLAQDGQRALLISEENLIGTMRNNLLDTRLYPLLQERLRRFVPAFEGRPLRIGLGVRSYEDYWASSLANLIGRGGSIPSEDLLDFLTTQPRRWRTMVRDIAAIFPEAEVVVWPFERLSNQPDAQLEALWGEGHSDLEHLDLWRNRAGDVIELNRLLALRGERLAHAGPVEAGTRWMPFNEDQRGVLRAEYRRDIAWLKAGAEGLARYVDGRPTPATPIAGRMAPLHPMTDGRQTPATRPDRAEVTPMAHDSAVTFGGRNDGIEKGLGRTGAS